MILENDLIPYIILVDYSYLSIEKVNNISFFCIINSDLGYSALGGSIPEIYYNNINASWIAIMNNSWIQDTIHAENNYYHTTYIDFIEEQLIWDKDDSPYPEFNGVIYWNPIEENEINSAGIQ